MPEFKLVKRELVGSGTGKIRVDISTRYFNKNSSELTDARFFNDSGMDLINAIFFGVLYLFTELDVTIAVSESFTELKDSINILLGVFRIAGLVLAGNVVPKLDISWYVILPGGCTTTPSVEVIAFDSFIPISPKLGSSKVPGSFSLSGILFTNAIKDKINVLMAVIFVVSVKPALSLIIGKITNINISFTVVVKYSMTGPKTGLFFAKRGGTESAVGGVGTV